MSGAVHGSAQRCATQAGMLIDWGAAALQLPLPKCCRMPWVFTYNDWSAGTEYDWMAQAAVTSAIEVQPMASCAARDVWLGAEAACVRIWPSCC